MTLPGFRLRVSPTLGWTDYVDNWHEMGQFTRSSDLCAPMKPVPAIDADDWHQVATYYFWQTDSKEIDEQRHYLLKAFNKEPEIVNFGGSRRMMTLQVRWVRL